MSFSRAGSVEHKLAMMFLKLGKSKSFYRSSKSSLVEIAT